ncbi:uncharacterized protein BKCO1_3000157 [Diplodia corticola]|uniref:Uncharacterized protein n=1 Tax=Diplodia corticola TaxID=236234 RepID=A0A1J9SGN7_9PEZI|nr:uncharacterized protein BKCO1_3000157 [Diplodia corticola]OJD38956.1 hypothetical protein BKCO1_3000157 [Diplodia corticola]
MVLCIPWLYISLVGRTIVWAITCGHYGFGYMVRTELGEPNPRSAFRALRQGFGRVRNIFKSDTHSDHSNRRASIDLEARDDLHHDIQDDIRDDLQPAARRNTYHQALAQIAQNNPRGNGDVIELNTISTVRQDNDGDNLTSEARKTAEAEANT